jgi:5-methylcytosine-specific restriction enzyme subunit McrC
MRRDLGEWQTLVLPGETLATSADRALAETLAQQQRAVVEELRDGVRVRALSWIGVIRFTRFEVRIHPKLAGGDAVVARLIDYVGGLDALSVLEGEPELRLEGCNLLDMVALLFTIAVRKVVRRGLLKDYCGFEEDLPVVRGRLLGDRQILRHFGRIERIECRFDERTADIVENRVLAAALDLLSRRVRSPAVARQVRQLQAIFGSACGAADRHEIALARNEFIYHRLNAHYEPAHSFAWLVFDGFGIEELLAPGSDRCFAFLIDMNRVFELFCERWVARLLRGSDWRVNPQSPCRSILWNASSNKSWGSVRPDLLIAHRSGEGASLPVDAKYKLYDQHKLDPADFYQLFLYAYAFAPAAGTERRLPAGLILFPASDSAGGERHRLHVRRVADRHSGAEVVLAAIPLARALSELPQTDSTLAGEFRSILTALLPTQQLRADVPLTAVSSASAADSVAF